MKRTFASLICGVLIISLFSIPHTIKAEEDKTELQQKEETTEVIQEYKEEIVKDEGKSEEPTPPVEDDLAKMYLAFNVVTPYGSTVLYTHEAVRGKVGDPVKFPEVLPKYFDSEVKILNEHILDEEVFQKEIGFIAVYVYVDDFSISTICVDRDKLNQDGMQAVPTLAENNYARGKEGEEYILKIPEIDGYKLVGIEKLQFLLDENMTDIPTIVEPTKSVVDIGNVKDGQLKVNYERGDISYYLHYTEVVEPVKPTEEKDKAKEKKKDGVNTGVDNSTVFYFGLAAVAVLTGIFVVVKKKKKD